MYQTSRSKKMNDEELIGPRIKELRKNRNITQNDIYKLTGISSGNLSSIETGKILPSAPSLMSLSMVFDCSVDYLLFGHERLSDNDQLCVPISEDEKYLIEHYRRLDKCNKEELQMISYVKAFHELPESL